MCVDDAVAAAAVPAQRHHRSAGRVDAARRRHRLRRASRSGRARASCSEETGLVGRIVELLAVDSLQPRGARRATTVEADYHSVRIVYRTEIVGGELRDETDESTDRAAWCTREELDDDAARRARPRSASKLAFGEHARLIRIPIRYGNAVALAPPDPRCSRARSRTSTIDGDDGEGAHGLGVPRRRSPRPT